MKAKLVTFTKRNMDNSQRSIISKKLFGYLDKSNNGNYTYKRKGILDDYKHVKISNNTFLIESKGWVKIKAFLSQKGITYKKWDIEISKI